MTRLLDRTTNLILSNKAALPDRPTDDRKKDKSVDEVKRKELPADPDN